MLLLAQHFFAKPLYAILLQGEILLRLIIKFIGILKYALMTLS
jgi:hypothetical protein